MGENNESLSLRDAIAAGFERVQAEENQNQAEADAGAANQGVNQASDSAAENAADSGMDGAQQAQAVETPFANTDGAVNTADAASQAQAAQNQGGGDMMAAVMQVINALRQENSRLSQELSRQQSAVQQQSDIMQGEIESAVTQPQIPKLNFRELQYMSEDEQAEAIQSWQDGVINMITERQKAEIEPIRREYENKRAAAADNAAKMSISSDPRFSDFGENSAEIDRIAAMSDFSGMAPDKKYLYSALIARGMRNSPAAKPSTEEIVQMAVSNPDVMRALEARRAQEVRDKNGHLPTLSASSGLSGANAMPEKSVKTKEDLDARVMSRFGFNR